jgi:excisionase family DNA binding protein
MGATEQTYLTVADLANATAESEAVWRKRIMRREIPFVKCGRNVRVLSEDLKSWLRLRSVPAFGGLRQ